VVQTHVRVSFSVCRVLFAGDSVSGANDAGGRESGSHGVYEWLGVVKRGRGAEIGGRVFWRFASDAARFNGQHSSERIECDGARRFAREV